MAITNTSRFGLPQWSEGTDPRPGRAETNAYLKAIADQAAIYVPSGVLSARPVAGIGGRFFLATDQGDKGRLYYDSGTEWVETGTNGGGGVPTSIVIGTAGSEGTSSRSARSDHSHSIPLATATNHGAMPSEWADRMQKVTSSATASTIPLRTSSGNLVVPTTPGGANDAASKSYVDNNSATGVTEATPNTLMKRGSSGTVHVKTGTFADDAANVAYVSSRINDHNHNAADLTSGYAPAARIRYSQWAYSQSWGGSGTVRMVHVTNGYELCYYSSTERHKTGIEPWDVDPRTLLAVEPVQFERVNPETGEPTGVRDWGVIAEQAGEHLPQFVQYADEPDENGDPVVEGWDYFRWMTSFQVLARWQAGRIDALEAERAELNAKLDELSERLTKLED